MKRPPTAKPKAPRSKPSTKATPDTTAKTALQALVPALAVGAASALVLAYARGVGSALALEGPPPAGLLPGGLYDSAVPPEFAQAAAPMPAQRNLFSDDVDALDDASKWAPLFSAKTDEHATDADTFAHWRDEVRARFGLPLVLDVAATRENTKCAACFTIADDGLAQDWKAAADDAARDNDPDAEHGAVWMNCPYSKCMAFVAKALAESARGLVVVALLPARTDTAWFHAILNEQHRCELHFLRGRLRFGDAKGSAPFPSVVVIFKGEKASP